uniref:dTMP kinase n=1 Tax=Trypanosoma congolense (strain IL3000) TaxID=1068625 RepID=F9WAT1_TRYCI|nr:unnamed protein product [Trypanosoma congolense IL3000]
MMRKVVVFVDVKSDELCSVIQQQVAKSVAEAEIVFLEGSFACTLNRRGRWMVDSVGTFACFITEKTLDHADVVYAVYYMRLPVLSLTEGRRARVSILETPSSLGVADGGSTIEGRAEAVRRFFAFEPTKSAVIVFEGGDGVGKATQTAYMVKRLGSEGHRVGTIDFPSDIHRYGDLIREILSGKKGGIRDLDPKLFSLLYSLNRFDCLNELRYWMKRGTKVVLDRYYTANYGHQASKLSEDERVDFIRHLELVEVGWFQLPPSDAVIYLDLPPPVALTAMKGDNKREALDIHETANVSYKEDVRRTYMWCCRNMPGWFHVGCCTDEGVRHSREETHELAYGKIKHCISKA